MADTLGDLFELREEVTEEVPEFREPTKEEKFAVPFEASGRSFPSWQTSVKVTSCFSMFMTILFVTGSYFERTSKLTVPQIVHTRAGVVTVPSCGNSLGGQEARPV